MRILSITKAKLFSSFTCTGKLAFSQVSVVVFLPVSKVLTVSEALLGLLLPTLFLAMTRNL